ncbi:MAG: hypothetical protein CVT48_06365 [Thermoplasmata archaeon HGW-Thermoplasmata-1]|nr:MAG: hypothetical protein CVT48_06365 [Thermoplasmata archaeon HGW-Thermoplasmata-1]
MAYRKNALTLLLIAALSLPFAGCIGNAGDVAEIEEESLEDQKIPSILILYLTSTAIQPYQGEVWGQMVANEYELARGPAPAEGTAPMGNSFLAKSYPTLWTLPATESFAISGAASLKFRISYETLPQPATSVSAYLYRNGEAIAEEEIDVSASAPFAPGIYDYGFELAADGAVFAKGDEFTIGIMVMGLNPYDASMMAVVVGGEAPPSVSFICK